MIIILMFICICNAISERQVQTAVAEGATTLSDLQAELGVAACCGCCADTASDYLPGGRHAGQATGEKQLTAVVAPAANDAVPMIEVVARRA
jgi:bacterioferritin-associated ferredoxin